MPSKSQKKQNRSWPWFLRLPHFEWDKNSDDSKSSLCSFSSEEIREFDAKTKGVSPDIFDKILADINAESKIMATGGMKKTRKNSQTVAGGLVQVLNKTLEEENAGADMSETEWNQLRERLNALLNRHGDEKSVRESPHESHSIKIIQRIEHQAEKLNTGCKKISHNLVSLKKLLQEIAARDQQQQSDDDFLVQDSLVFVSEMQDKVAKVLKAVEDQTSSCLTQQMLFVPSNQSMLLEQTDTLDNSMPSLDNSNLLMHLDKTVLPSRRDFAQQTIDLVQRKKR